MEPAVLGGDYGGQLVPALFQIQLFGQRVQIGSSMGFEICNHVFGGTRQVEALLLD